MATSVAEQDDRPWSQVDFGSGRGHGLVATRDLRRGDFIFDETPLAVFLSADDRSADGGSDIEDEDFSTSESENENEDAVDEHSNHEEKLLLEQHADNSGGHQEEASVRVEITRTNKQLSRQELDRFAEIFPLAGNIPGYAQEWRKRQLVGSRSHELTRKLEDLRSRSASCFDRYFALADSFGPPTVGRKTGLGIWQTNALSIPAASTAGLRKLLASPAEQNAEADADFLPSVMCPTVARMNHSCSPNVLHFWIDSCCKMRAIAARDIRKGQELCTSYSELRHDRNTRQEFLRDHFQFDCGCEACSRAVEESSDRQEQSDSRRRRAMRLAGKLGLVEGSAAIACRKKSSVGAGSTSSSSSGDDEDDDDYARSSATSTPGVPQVEAYLELMEAENICCPMFEYQACSRAVELAVRGKNKAAAERWMRRLGTVIGQMKGCQGGNGAEASREGHDAAMLPTMKPESHPLWGQKQVRSRLPEQGTSTEKATGRIPGRKDKIHKGKSSKTKRNGRGGD